MSKGFSKGVLAARNLMLECGIDDVTTISLEDLVAYKGALLVEEKMHNADGRIIHGNRRSIIKVNSEIQYPGRKRFTIAHELGHLVMHRDYPIHSDTKSLDWFDSALKNLKTGFQELEANEFASELLMPADLFKCEVRYKKFTPDLLRNLAERFQTSITSVAFKCVEMNVHPICLFFISDGVIRYWKKSDSLKCWITDRNKMPPHEYTVATEYIDAGYEPVYTKDESQQEINKSAWFDVRDDDEDEAFYEYCIPTKQYKTILSVVWQD